MFQMHTFQLLLSASYTHPHEHVSIFSTLQYFGFLFFLNVILRSNCVTIFRAVTNLQGVCHYSDDLHYCQRQWNHIINVPPVPKVNTLIIQGILAQVVLLLLRAGTALSVQFQCLSHHDVVGLIGGQCFNGREWLDLFEKLLEACHIFFTFRFFSPVTQERTQLSLC